MQQYDRDIWFGENRLHLNKDNILNMTLVGEMNEETAIELICAIQELENKVDGKVNIFR